MGIRAVACSVLIATKVPTVCAWRVRLLSSRVSGFVGSFVGRRTAITSTRRHQVSSKSTVRHAAEQSLRDSRDIRVHLNHSFVRVLSSRQPSITCPLIYRNKSKLQSPNKPRLLHTTLRPYPLASCHHRASLILHCHIPVR